MMKVSDERNGDLHSSYPLYTGTSTYNCVHKCMINQKAKLPKIHLLPPKYVIEKSWQVLISNFNRLWLLAEQR